MADNRQQLKEPTLGHYVGSLGGKQPFIVINNYILNLREVKLLEIDSTGFYPKIKLIIHTNSGMFLSRHFPKDGDLVNIYVRSMEDSFHPIRNDYLITKVTTNRSLDREGSRMTFYIDGILRIPLLYKEICKAIDKTSFETLIDIATEINLGFVTNEKSTSDKMPWISAWQTYRDYIEHVTSHSYKDDNSFYDSFIDIYYNLNFLNMNKVMSVDDDEEIKDGMGRSIFKGDYNLDTSIHFTKMKNMLSNSPEYKTTNYYFDSIEMVNKSGELSVVNGYKRHVHFYDKALKKEIDLKVDPFVTSGAEENKVILKGRAFEDHYLSQTKRKWTGVQYSLPDHNVHNYYKYAEYLNFHNNEEIGKINIKLNLPTPNFNFYRGQRIPLAFVLTKDATRINVAGNVEDKSRELGFTLDRFISGHYTIIGIKYIYKLKTGESFEAAGFIGSMEQQLILSRREWTMPDTPKFQTK